MCYTSTSDWLGDKAAVNESDSQASTVPGDDDEAQRMANANNAHRLAELAQQQHVSTPQHLIRKSASGVSDLRLGRGLSRSIFSPGEPETPADVKQARATAAAAAASKPAAKPTAKMTKDTQEKTIAKASNTVGKKTLGKRKQKTIKRTSKRSKANKTAKTSKTAKAKTATKKTPTPVAAHPCQQAPPKPSIAPAEPPKPVATPTRTNAPLASLGSPNIVTALLNRPGTFDLTSPAPSPADPSQSPPEPTPSPEHATPASTPAAAASTEHPAPVHHGPAAVAVPKQERCKNLRARKGRFFRTLDSQNLNYSVIASLAFVCYNMRTMSNNIPVKIHCKYHILQSIKVMFDCATVHMICIGIVNLCLVFSLTIMLAHRPKVPMLHLNLESWHRVQGQDIGVVSSRTSGCTQFGHIDFHQFSSPLKPWLILFGQLNYRLVVV